jgi:hypothetical protein
LSTRATKRLGHSIRRRGTLAAGMAAVVGIFVVATAAPAFAHTADLAGTTVCSNGNHVVTWTIGSSDTTLPMTIDTVTATLNDSQQFPVVGAAVGTSVPAEGSISASTTVPGDMLGNIILHVAGSWSDGHADDKTFSVALISACGPDTTTTTTEATTSTTEAPTTSTTAATTTTEAPTSTTVATSTTPPSTTSSTPITTEGSTVQTTTTTEATGALGSTTPTTASPTGVTAAAVTPSANTGALPFTGSSDSGPIIGLSSLVAGGLALVLARRRHSAR